MSNRTLLEINHDCWTRIADPAFDRALLRYLHSASRETAEDLELFGVRVIAMRHHTGKFILDGEPDGFPVQYLPKDPAHDRG